MGPLKPSAFRQWFDGFTEAIDVAPSDEQWQRIKAQVARLDGPPVIESRYLGYPPYYFPQVYLPQTRRKQP